MSTVRFGQLDVKDFKSEDVAEHSASGPDASKITDGVFAPEGTEWNDTRYSVVLPSTNDVRHALVIDLGAVVSVCGGSTCANKPTIQADNNDRYQLDYSSDGTNWTTFGQFQTVSDSHLRRG